MTMIKTDQSLCEIALNKLNFMGILHHDARLENFIITKDKDQNDLAVILDFAFSEIFETRKEPESLDSSFFRRVRAAPNLWSEQSYSSSNG